MRIVMTIIQDKKCQDTDWLTTGRKSWFAFIGWGNLQPHCITKYHVLIEIIAAQSTHEKPGHNRAWRPKPYCLFNYLLFINDNPINLIRYGGCRKTQWPGLSLYPGYMSRQHPLLPTDISTACQWLTAAWHATSLPFRHHRHKARRSRR